MEKTLLYRSNLCLQRTLIVAFVALLWWMPGIIFGQSYYTAEVSFAVKLGTTKPLFESVNVAATDADKLKERKANKPHIVPNFGGRRQLESHHPDALPKGMDPLFNPAANRMSLNTILPLINIEGIHESASGSTPPDVNGDVGRDFYVEIVNSTFFKVFDKSGVAVSNLISANSIWSQVGQSSAGDPIILYDQEVDRWLLTEFPSTNRVLVAISHTTDPRGAWDVYAFQTPRFPDFPKYGIWPDAYYLTTNEFGANASFYAINRDDILAGAAMARIQRLTSPKVGGISFEVGQPIDWDGMERPPAGSPGLVVKLNDDDWGQTTFDHIMLHKITIDWDSSAASKIEIIQIPTAPYDTDGCQLETTGGFSCIPQPNNQGIDGAEWIIANKAPYRNFGSHESFVMTFMVDVTGNDVAGIRWIEFRKDTSSDWSIYQEGTVGSDDGIHRFMPSISIDGKGNIGLAYSVSGYNKFPSLRYTGRYVTDPPGIMTFKEHEFVSGGGSQGFDRFGDYASMSVDPADDATFWFAGEYLPDNANWSTRIVAFRAYYDTIDVFPLSLITPLNDNTLGKQAVSFRSMNRGLNTVFDFPIGYQFNNGDWIMEHHGLDSLIVNEAFSYTFDTLVSIDAPGNYPIRIATFLDNDRNKLNDTLAFVITKYAFHDVALEYVVPNIQGSICSDIAENTVFVRNNGYALITSFSMQVTHNDVIVDTILWTGEIVFQEEIEVSFLVDDLIEGDNRMDLTILEINGTEDEIPANNEISWTLQARPTSQRVFLYFKTDNFPQESTWKVFDAENNIIGTGGPFATPQNTTITEFCLDPELCYTMTIYDAFGDGITQGNDGYFEIFNEEGILLARLVKANFGTQSSSQFCLTAECLFQVEVGTGHESTPGSNDGFAIVEVANSLGAVRYSINGGITFGLSNTFLNLSPGIYNLLAQDAAGCLDSLTFEILACNLNTMISTQPAVGGDVGEIHIAVSGGNGPVMYSLNGGAFAADSFFVMLEPGDYMVTIRDSVGCEFTTPVTISTSVGTTILPSDYFILISPNPGTGVYQVTASFDTKNIFVEYTMLTMSGESLFNGTLVRYDNQYHSEVSLTAYPPGMYLIAFRVGTRMYINRILKV